MRRPLIFDHIEVNRQSATPKYLQLTTSILRAIDSGELKKDDLLPSINQMSFELDISRRTIEKGYTYLKRIGVLGSVPGKAFFIKWVKREDPLKIILLFDKLSTQKKIIYESLVAKLGNNVRINLYIYNNDSAEFVRILMEKKEGYSYYIIIPYFEKDEQAAYKLINTIPKEKLILLDKRISSLTGSYAAVYGNFESNIYDAMIRVSERLNKYDTLKIIFPLNSYYSTKIPDGLRRFCKEHGFNYKKVENIGKEPVRRGEVYISLLEDDLVTIIEKVKNTNLKIGTDLGIISYDESPLKKIILNGITTISIDFQEMGSIAGQLILNHSKKQVEVSFSINLRESL